MKNLFLFLSFLAHKSFSQDVSELLVNSTTKLVGIKDSLIDGKKQSIYSTGTGFFFQFVIGKDSINAIVTNEHVLHGCHTEIFKFTRSENNKPVYGDILTDTIKDFQKFWIKHPSQDLAIIFLNPISQLLYKKYKKTPFFVFYSENEIPKSLQWNDFTSIEEVIMIGYPKGLADVFNNLPVVRKGLTATPLFIKYNNEDKFLLDIAIYPGSSGSPITLYNNGNYSDKKGSLIVGHRLLLVGIAVQSQNYEANGITIPQDSIPSLKTKTLLPFDVAVCIKSTSILDFKSQIEALLKNNR